MGNDVAPLSDALRRDLLTAQQNEITERHIYLRLADREKDPKNAEILRRIGNDELRHYECLRRYTDTDVAPNNAQVRWYTFLAAVLGLTFSIKLMERGEERAQASYDRIAEAIPEVGRFAEEEEVHEAELIGMIDEERLRYAGSMVLGLNDALVELTGALAGLTLALANVRLIGMAGLITGIAASMSMAASEYLSTKSEQSEQDPTKASVYTGIAYVLTVVLLIVPYFVVSNYLVALAWTLLNAILIIVIFTYYVSVAQDVPFRRRFVEMAGISLGVAALSFFIGFLVREFLGIDV
jgi:VIT1/CCC1 family predicted Fe2+/Mn2+ transporter